MTPRPFATLRAVVAEVHGITSDQLLGQHRALRFSHARQMLACLARELFGMSYVQIGQLMRRDHTTISHAQRAVRRRMIVDEMTRHRVTRILAEYTHRMVMKGAR